MKWSRLSLGHQIAVIGIVLAALLVIVVVVNVTLVLEQNEAAWREKSRLVQDEAERALMERLEEVKLAAATVAAEPAMLDAGGSEAGQESRQRLMNLIAGLCPAMEWVEVNRVSTEAPMVANGFSNLTSSSDLSEGADYGILYTHWVGSNSGERVQIRVGAELLSSLLPRRSDARIMLVDADQLVVACNDPAKIGTRFYPTGGEVYVDSRGQRYMQQMSEVIYDRFQVITLTSGAAELEQRVGLIIPVNIGVSLFLVGIAAVCFYMLHLSVSKPIGDMMDTLSILRMRPGTRISMALRGNQEMMELSRSFNKMMDENERLNGKLMEANVRLYQAELVRRQTDMAMLVSQINPHFLYNTLEVIKGMAHRVGSKTIVEMTRALGTIFRYSLKAPEVVTLRQEAAMLNDYLTIQLARFGDRFQVHMDLPEQLMEQDMLKMVLQPLVENAITHGLEMMEKGGHLYVSAHRNMEGFFLVVEDNGLGMDEETLQLVRSKLDMINDVSSLYEMGSDGLGLVNVHGRIRMRYGEGYGLTIDSQQGTGTRVVLRMPGRRPEDFV